MYDILTAIFFASTLENLGNPLYFNSPYHLDKLANFTSVSKHVIEFQENRENTVPWVAFRTVVVSNLILQLLHLSFTWQRVQKTLLCWSSTPKALTLGPAFYQKPMDTIRKIRKHIHTARIYMTLYSVLVMPLMEGHQFYVVPFVMWIIVV